MPIVYDGPSYSGSKASWLGSREGVDTARTGTLRGFQGVVPAGTPVTADDGFYVEYDGASLAGFVLRDINVVDGEDTPAPILDRGRIRVNRLPVEFTPPADSGRFAFVDVESGS